MAVYYVKYRKIGPQAVFSVIANNRQAALTLVANSAAAGEEFDIWDANQFGHSGLVSATGPTGPSGATGSP